MSYVVLGCFAFGTFLVRFLFIVGFLTPYWIEESNATYMGSTNSSIPLTTGRTCYHGLFYSLYCPKRKNGKYFWSKMHIHVNDFSVTCEMCPFCFALFILSNCFLCYIGIVAEARLLDVISLALNVYRREVTFSLNDCSC